jgi:PKD repeat protein
MRTTNQCTAGLMQVPGSISFWQRWHRLLSTLIAFLFLAAALFFTKLSYGQGPCASSNCTSGDIRITKVELLKSDGTALPNVCVAGQSNIQVMLRVTFDVTSATRYGFLVTGDISINNGVGRTIANCDGATFTQGLHTMDVLHYADGTDILWPCGSTIQLKNVYTAWDQQVATASHAGICSYLGSNGSISNCSEIAPKCKFYGDDDPLTIYAPLIADFTWSGSCTTGHLAQTIAFTNITSGGKAGYMYVWDFGDGSATSTATSPSHDYAIAGNYTVTLTATDASTPTAVVDQQLYLVSVGSCCAPPTINSQPSNQSKCQGTNASFTVGYTGGTPAPAIQWQVNTGSGFTNIANGGVYAGASTATLTITGVTPSMNGYTYQAVLQSGSCTAVTSNAASLNVSASTVAGTLGSSTTVCTGSTSGLLTLSGYTGNIVRWESSPTGAVGSWSPIVNTVATYTSGTLSADIWLRAIVKSGVCDELASNAIKITIQQPISNNTIASSQTICSGTAPAALTGSTPTGGSGSYTYQWQSRTTGFFADISGASNKDYAPGALNQTTQFRRIVSGSACGSSTSDAVTITISPESVVYSLMASNYCSSNAQKGTIVLAGSYPGVSYQLKKQSDNSDVQGPQIGTGFALTWPGVEGGTYYVAGTGIAPTYCGSTTAFATVHEFDCSAFYTLTQGYYGGKNGKTCIGTTPVNTIKYLLGTTELVAGSTNSVTVPANNDGAVKLNSVLPGGGTPTALPVGNCTVTLPCFKYPTYLTKQARIGNNLLSQTITLLLNTRWDGGRLSLFQLHSGWLTTQKLLGCGNSTIVVTQCADGVVSSIRMNQNVVDYLGSNNTVQDLLNLANGVLGGTLMPGQNGVPSYSDVNDAVDAVNKSFDEGRRFLDYYSEHQTCESLFPESSTIVSTLGSSREISQMQLIAASKGVSVTAYPNPYTDKVSFTVQTDIAGYGSLQVYNIMGQKVKTVYEGYVAAGKQNFTLTLPVQQRANLVYIFKVGGKQVQGKLLQLRR